MLYSARHAVSASLLPLIKYFDRLIRISMAGMKEEMTVYKLICFGGFSFLYGFIHAAGPGHGKSIVSAYFWATSSPTTAFSFPFAPRRS